jgi:hypothetical protein
MTEDAHELALGGDRALEACHDVAPQAGVQRVEWVAAGVGYVRHEGLGAKAVAGIIGKPDRVERCAVELVDGLKIVVHPHAPDVVGVIGSDGVEAIDHFRRGELDQWELLNGRGPKNRLLQVVVIDGEGVVGGERDRLRLSELELGQQDFRLGQPAHEHRREKEHNALHRCRLLGTPSRRRLRRRVPPGFRCDLGANWSISAPTDNCQQNHSI